MRRLNKFQAVCALALCSLFISAWFLLSHQYYRRVLPQNTPGSDFQAATSFDQRLVVFGDSWSDNNAGELQGSVWTDTLCSLFSCHQENLAQTAKSLSGNYIGSVVDNAELPAPLLNIYKSPLADFKAQVSQWVASESEAVHQLMGDEDSLQRRQNRTILAISFGLWDVWNMLDKGYEAAAQSVDRSVGVVMDQLNVLSETLGSNDLKVILTLTPDVTFLPAFRPTANQHVGRHKDAVRITEYWNHELRGAAQRWDRGMIYLFDTNTFLADLIRDWQLFAAGIEEPNGLGKNLEPGWENVEDACVETNQQLVMTSEGKACDNPEKYLFWNEMHMGPSAHRLMGTEVFHGIEEMWLAN
ncbi:hypothetical protein FE257_009236 [Aspergillus nanangensis]|uniref:Uncharacterized protein n=1 Tax=Aspergillus nanangensis TaxID=2582783 RepID=A0AAD4GSZ3_ASPNN|nr:hypothetical protein FE257_009236 [Aspergillus nanangensis]